MENRARPLKTAEHTRGGSVKFKPIKGEYNELQSKYQIYKNGTPNIYQKNIESLKAYHIKSDIKTLQLPAIDYILQQLKNIPENTGTNLRDFTIHPSMMQKYGNKFRNLISDSQEIKDFMEWFNNKEKEINSRTVSQTEKFYLYQSLIASGFNQMLTQIGFVSKLRADVLRTLWNKQNCEVEQVFNFMHKQNSEFQKKSLETVKILHLGYQQQIIGLRNDNYCAEKKLEQAVILNESCINSLRTMRKQIKKYEKIIKQITQSNYCLKQESLQILEENIKLVMRQKNIPFEKARVLAYQSLQARNIRHGLNGGKKAKTIFKDVRNKAEAIVQNNQLPDLEQKKEKLVKYIMNRIKENPGQKNFIMKNELSDEDDEQVKLQETIQDMIKCKQIKSEIFIKAPKPINFFQDKSVNTEPIQFESTNAQQINLQSIGVQTLPMVSEKQTVNLIDSFKNEEVEGKKMLQKKKIEQRHSLMMIQMSKMMEFKKMDGSIKANRITPLGKMIQSSRFSKASRFSSQNQQKILKMKQEVEQESFQMDDSFSKEQDDKSEHKELKKRQINIIKRHHQSLIQEKSSQFKQMIETISKQLSQPKHNPVIPIEQITINKPEEPTEKTTQLKQLVRKYLEKKGNQKQLSSNPQKQLKKILTHTFKNLFVSKKCDFLKELVRTAKNSFGNVIYENKLVHLISLIIENKQISLLGALNVLMGISNCPQNYPNVNYEDVNQIYFKMYFYLSTKSPIQNQFNIWGNYTTVQKINNSNFNQMLKLFFSESKCMYLKLKIRQFIGVGNQQQSSQNNYYVKLNPLMMYVLEVYLLEKQNYYESYHHIIDFLSQSQSMDLETFVFVLDLLCFKEEEQKNIIKQYLKEVKQGGEIIHLNKDIFYRICVKFQVPLFEFIKILKLEQFKKLHQCLQNELLEISQYIQNDKWGRTKENIEKMLKMKGSYSSNIRKIIKKIDNHIKSCMPANNEAFLFFYRIVIHTAFSSP